MDSGASFALGEIEIIKKVWAQAVIEQKAEPLLALYSPNAQLRPAFSPIQRNNLEEIKDYFVGGEKFNDPGFFKIDFAEVSFASSNPKRLQEKIVDEGKYIFKKRNGEMLFAKYMMIYEKNGEGKWTISYHESVLEEESN